LKYTQSGTAITTFNLAVNRPTRKDARESDPTCDFIRCVCWQHNAEFTANYLGKGRLVGIVGRLEINQWVTQEGEQQRYSQVNCHDVRALDKKPDEEKQSGGKTADHRTVARADAEEYGPDPFAEA
jgi:single-strand DNA-binding protein